jgi:cytochrome c-type biogenesis protein CcmH
VWLGPVVLLLAGAFVILRQVRRGPEGPAAPESSPPPPPPAAAETGAEDPYLQAVRRELER